MLVPRYGLLKRIWIASRKGRLKQGILRRILTKTRCSKSFIPVAVRTVDVELTNFCNQKCEFCPTGLGTVGRAKGKMTRGTFVTIAQQLHPETVIQLAGYGEPFLNDHLEEFLECAASLGLRNIEIFPNFGAMKEKRIRNLLDFPFHSLTISLDAMRREKFRLYKGCDQFDRVSHNIRVLAEEARSRKRYNQYLYVQMVVTQKNVDEVSSFRDYVSSIGLIPVTKSLNTYMSLASDDKSREWEVPELSRYNLIKKGRYSFACPWIWGGMLVFWNGDVTICCEDPMGTSIYGNVNEKSLSELMNAERSDFRRQYFKDPSKIMICKGCSIA